MAATMHASRSMSVTTSGAAKPAAARFARAAQRAARPASRSAVVVKAGQCHAVDHGCLLGHKAPTQSSGVELGSAANYAFYASVGVVNVPDQAGSCP
jgi:hypothetical protein